MPGYLDGYGAGVDRREKTVKYVVLCTVASVVLGAVLYYCFRDYPQKRQVAKFLDAAKSGDYKQAYSLWGCTDATPCRDYRFEKFLEDWGPSSPHSNLKDANVSRTIGCDTGVVADVQFGSGAAPVLLWAERGSGTLGFFPYHLRPVPDDLKSRTAVSLWKLTRNCKPLLE